MKRVNKILAIIFAVVLINSCTEGFEEINTNPESLAHLGPEQLLYRAQTEFLLSGHAWNSIYIAKYPWVQYGTPHMWFAAQGNMETRWTYHSNAIGNSIYDEYMRMGSYITTIEHTAGKASDPEFYSDLVQMGRILLIAKAIQTSDMWGSLVYSDGWLANRERTDDASMNPAFETQAQLVEVWDRELKECIQKLQARLTASSKVSLSGIDRAYNGDAQQWIKAANAIRLRLASRIWKRLPQQAEAIAAEVLAPANAANVFSSVNDNLILWYDNLFTTMPGQGGDWHSVEDLNRASATMMDYLNGYEDPRREIFYRINNLSERNIEEFNRQEKVARRNPLRMIPPHFERYMGAVVSFDSRAALPVVPLEPGPGDDPLATTPIAPPIPNRANFPTGTAGDDAYNAAADAYYENFDFSVWDNLTYDRRWARILLRWPETTTDIDMLPANVMQTRLWFGRFDGGSGGNWAPIMTYADFAFLAAEFVLRANVTSARTAQQWYEAGLRASIDTWNDVGDYCRIHNYEAMTEDAIANFLEKPGIKWDAATGLEQIYAQTYVEHFKNVDEAWAFWKRTNYPNPESNIITFERVFVLGIERFPPRRARLTLPAPTVLNYENQVKRVEDMQLDPHFGEMGNEWGRVWWDVP